MPAWTEQSPAAGCREAAPNAQIILAHEADFMLGPMRVSPSCREAMQSAFRYSLEPRVMQVLVALQRAHGAVVSRDDLIARCWNGRVVGDDAINRAIGQLRRLSKTDHGESFIVETVPRVGYRLCVSHIAAPPHVRWWQSAVVLVSNLFKGEVAC
jgi:DNA-binding winged helix-turn-helix (wHTH) protein